MKTTLIDTQAGDFKQSIRDFMTRLLESDLVGSILLPKRTTAGDNYVQALVKNPALLADTDVSAPVMPVQAARLISHLTFSDPGEKIAVVVKPCEARALVELTKFQQVRRESFRNIIEWHNDRPMFCYFEIYTRTSRPECAQINSADPSGLQGVVNRVTL